MTSTQPAQPSKRAIYLTIAVPLIIAAWLTGGAVAGVLLAVALLAIGHECHVV